jgi:hypothetical protein
MHLFSKPCHLSKYCCHDGVCRRAKRLKKLHRMVQSNAVQRPTAAWKRHTLMLLAVMLVARIVCFVVLDNQVADRRG